MFYILVKVINILISPFLYLTDSGSLRDAYNNCVASSVATIMEMKFDGIKCTLSNVKIYIYRFHKELFKPN